MIEERLSSTFRFYQRNVSPLTTPPGFPPSVPLPAFCDGSLTSLITGDMSCEAVPASDLATAGMRRHVHSGNHAAESLVSFSPLLGGPCVFASFFAPWLATPSHRQASTSIDVNCENSLGLTPRPDACRYDLRYEARDHRLTIANTPIARGNTNSNRPNSVVAM